MINYNTHFLIKLKLYNEIIYILDSYWFGKYNYYFFNLKLKICVVQGGVFVSSDSY